MIKLKCVATGSSGNCYLLSTETETLILDCGIPVREIKKGLNFDLSKVVGCVVSHGHSDHSLSVKEFEKMGIPIFKPYEKTEIVDRKKFGSFNTVCFQLPHNGVDNYGFYIKIENQKVLYLTDFEYCKFTFDTLDVNHILVECNYQKEFVNRMLANYEHKMRGHCSLDTCKDFVEANATDSLRTVLLLHMGVQTCNPYECVAEVQKVARKSNVDFARQGLEIELRTDECPF